ncbi:MAG: glutamine--fructose-6-phosphate transaminase (isomerizing), partial [Bradyrhizobium sp.]
MCGIVGILGRAPVAEQLVDSLKRLEYRGYDSAGVATLEGDHLDRRRAEGKLKNLEARLRAEPLAGHTGIGHTRWATHGKPNENNAHPHATARVAVVHNGIIENFRELRQQLEKNGAVFKTETDTEIVVHLVDGYLASGINPVEAVKASLAQLRGAFALGFIFAGDDDLMIGARNGPPLAIGHGDGEMYLGSDAIALGPFTDTISYLEDGDWVVLTRNSATIYDRNNQIVHRDALKHSAATALVDKANYRHFMAKEIHEQPEVVGHTLARYIDMATERVALPLQLPFDFKDIQRISIVACGTASYAGYVAKYWFERLSRLPVEIDVASEFRYREAPLRKGDLAIFISQSGETADTLAALRYAKSNGVHTLSVVNVPTSTIARESETLLPTLAGPEIGVASTKAFTCQLMVLAVIAIAAGRARDELSEVDEARLVHGLVEIPRLMAAALATEPQIEKLARDIAKSRDVLYLGRGTSYPLALEGALKLKEISYIHAEGYPAGEMKHGPNALIDEKLPVVVLATRDPDSAESRQRYEKTLSNIQEVKARSGIVIAVAC